MLRFECRDPYYATMLVWGYLTSDFYLSLLYAQYTSVILVL